MRCYITYKQTRTHTLTPCPASIKRFPSSRVTLAVPSSTMSIIVLKAFNERRSVGEMKFPIHLGGRKGREGGREGVNCKSTSNCTATIVREGGRLAASSLNTLLE